MVVLSVGLAVHRPLSRVPENTLKFGVGVMLTSFGMFWTTEGAGATWPGGDVFILVADRLRDGRVARRLRRRPAPRAVALRPIGQAA